MRATPTVEVCFWAFPRARDVNVYSGKGVAIMSVHSHIASEQLESYAMGRLAEEETVSVEEHLLLCEPCQQRLQELDDFLEAFRLAAAEARAPSRGFMNQLGDLVSSLFPNRPSFALGAVAAAALAVVFLVPRQHETPATYSVALDSARGGRVAGAVPAPQGHRLQLSLDLRGIPERETYSVAIVSSAGRAVFTAQVIPAAGRLTLLTTSALPPGDYWVRVNEPLAPHGLLREFQLTVQ